MIPGELPEAEVTGKSPACVNSEMYVWRSEYGDAHRSPATWAAGLKAQARKSFGLIDVPAPRRTRHQLGRARVSGSQRVNEIGSEWCHDRDVTSHAGVVVWRCSQQDHTRSAFRAPAAPVGSREPSGRSARSAARATRRGVESLGSVRTLKSVYPKSEKESWRWTPRARATYRAATGTP